MGGDGPSRSGAGPVTPHTMTVGVAGVKGAGVSTVAHAVAAASGPAVLVEADPSGGSLLAWCEALQPAADLYDVVMSRGDGGLTAAAQQLGELAVLPSWGTSFRMAQALSRPRVPWELLFGEVEGTVVVDVGRIAPESPTLGLLAAMDVVVLVAPSEPGPVAATMEWANRAGRHGAGGVGLPAERLRMVTTEVVSRRRRHSVTPRDLSAVTGAAFLGHFPHDDDAVELLRRGVAVTDRSLRGRRFVEMAQWVARALADPTRVGIVG